MEEENEKIRGRDWRTGHFSRGEILKRGVMSRSQKVDFVSFYFLSHFYFLLIYFAPFLFLEHWG